jgi:hypothetical protein
VDSVSPHLKKLRKVKQLVPELIAVTKMHKTLTVLNSDIFFRISTSFQSIFIVSCYLNDKLSDVQTTSMLILYSTLPKTSQNEKLLLEELTH